MSSETPTKKKRVVSPNWSVDEISLLTDKSTFYASVLDKKYDDVVTKEKKKKIWSEISIAISALGHFQRTPADCKKKWQNIKSMSTSSVKTWFKASNKTGII